MLHDAGGGAPEALLTSEELAARTGIRTRQSVHDGRRKGRIIGRQNARRGCVFPRAQFDERNWPQAGLDRVAQAVQGDRQGGFAQTCGKPAYADDA